MNTTEQEKLGRVRRELKEESKLPKAERDALMKIRMDTIVKNVSIKEVEQANARNPQSQTAEEKRAAIAVAAADMQKFIDTWCPIK